MRRLRLKFKRHSYFYVQILVVLFILAFLFDKIVIEKRLFWRRPVEIQKDLLIYNNDGLRKEWPFRIDKHYDVYDLRSYTSKPKMFPRSDLPGEGGAPVILSKVIDDVAELSFSEYQINVVASDKVSLNRSLPDFRDSKCVHIKYPKRLPSTSIVMSVHNEAWSILLRTIWSVFNRTPSELLEEIILIDDFSDKAHMKKQLDEYLDEHFSGKVKLIRTDQREGLTRARLIGADKSQGQVIVFLDANVEVNEGWLEPLLSRIASDRSVVAVPRIDHISPLNMSYVEHNRTVVYGIGWNLFHYEYRISDRETIRIHGDATAPYRTPALVGTAIAVDREFFYEIGSFDEKMNIWGGENIEMSLRVWNCGGAIEIIPCSRVGHHFRQLPYSFNADNAEEIKIQNNIRIAEIWMDEYTPYFDSAIPSHYKKLRGGDISERIEIRKKLKCKRFHWYLQNVSPESVMSAGFRKIGQIQRTRSKFCLDRLGRKNNRQIGIYQCHGNGYSQGFAYQKNQQIVFHHSNCLSLAQKENVTYPTTTNLSVLKDPNLLTPDMNTTNHVVLLECNATNGDKWMYNEAKNQIVHMKTGMCLATELWMVVVAPCNMNDERQGWMIFSFDEYKRKLLSELNNKNRGNPT